MDLVNNFNQTKQIRPVRIVAGQGIYTRHSRGLLSMVLVATLFMLTASLLKIMKEPQVVIELGVYLAVAIAIVRWPIVGTYLAVLMPILFDAFPNTLIHTTISDMGVFRNLSYRGLPDFVYISLFELVVAVTLASQLIRRFHDHKKLERGPLYRPILIFGAMVVMGELNGLTSGGDFKITLWEIRPLLYFVLLYLVAVNTINKAVHLRVIMWIVTLATLARCFEGVYRYFSLPPDVRYLAPVILEHDDSLFFCVAVGLAVATFFWRKWLPRRFFVATILLVPFAVYLMDINGRRAVFLCVLIMLAAYVPLFWSGMRSKLQRKHLVYFLITCAVLGSAYLAVFWNREGGIAAPAASVKSIFVPNERDYLSNLYRDQENINLRYTIGFSPVIGIGFGKPFLVIEPMVDLTKDWALQYYMPHNNMLWLWLRMGVIGFVAFWVALGGAILLAAACLRLGAAHLRMLIQQEDEEELALHPLRNRPARGATTPGAGVYVVRCRTPKSGEANGTLRHQSPAPSRQWLARRVEMRECAEFLVFTMMTLATFVALVGLGVVDQGLMSFRLSAFAGVAMGGLAAAWNMYNLKYRVPVEADVNTLPEQEGIIAPRRRMRQLART